MKSDRLRWSPSCTGSPFRSTWKSLWPHSGASCLNCVLSLKLNWFHCSGFTLWSHWHQWLLNCTVSGEGGAQRCEGYDEGLGRRAGAACIATSHSSSIFDLISLSLLKVQCLCSMRWWGAHSSATHFTGIPVSVGAENRCPMLHLQTESCLLFIVYYAQDRQARLEALWPGNSKIRIIAPCVF